MSKENADRPAVSIGVLSTLAIAVSCFAAGAASTALNDAKQFALDRAAMSSATKQLAADAEKFTLDQVTLAAGSAELEALGHTIGELQADLEADKLVILAATREIDACRVPALGQWGTFTELDSH